MQSLITSLEPPNEYRYDAPKESLVPETATPQVSGGEVLSAHNQFPYRKHQRRACMGGFLRLTRNLLHGVMRMITSAI